MRAAAPKGCLPERPYAGHCIAAVAFATSPRCRLDRRDEHRYIRLGELYLGRRRTALPTVAKAKATGMALLAAGVLDDDYRAGVHNHLTSSGLLVV